MQDQREIFNNVPNVNGRNTQKAKDIVNAFLRRMLQDLIVVPGKDGTGVPVAGAYFTKLLDHTPGALQPLSALITDENGFIDTITQVLEPFDSVIVPQEFRLPGMGAFAVSVTITDIKNCNLTYTGWISAGFFSQVSVSRPALCVNDTLQLIDVIR